MTHLSNRKILRGVSVLAAFLLFVQCLAFPTAVFADGQNGDADSASKEATEMNAAHYGLHVESDGTITLEGQPFYGYGLNLFGAFAHYYGVAANGTDALEATFAGVSEHHIPFVRLPLSGFYPDYYDLYDDDTEYVLSLMKDVLDMAQKYQVGVVVSLMWWDPAVAGHIEGGKRSDMGNPESELTAYSKSYVETIVRTFADHPAVWGWEIGNEYNLNADLCDPSCVNYLWGQSLPGFRNKSVNCFDYYTSDELAVYYTEIASVIRQYDGYRMITTGNGEMRSSSWALHSASKRPTKKHSWSMRWDDNTFAQFEESNRLYTPDPIDTVCFHLQHGSGDGSHQYELKFSRFGEYISSLDYFKAYVDVAKSMNKALFFGEFGDFRDMEQDEDMLTHFHDVCSWIGEAGIQICALWQFQDYSDTGVAAEKLDILSEFNLKQVESGLQNTGAAWEQHEVPTSPEQPTQTDPADDGESQTADAASGPVSENVGEPTDTAVASASPETGADNSGAGCGSALKLSALFITLALSCVAFALSRAGSLKKKTRNP